MKRTLGLAALLALLAATPLAGAQDLGRLFFTPEQRAALDRQRSTREPERAPIVVAPKVRLDGFVKRSGGKSTVWLNGAEVDAATRLPEAGDKPVTVRAAAGGDTIRLKAGETLDRGSGEIQDVIGGGEIRVRRGTP